MPTPLYLDTARLGRISPGAQQAHLEFVRLAAEEPSSLYFEEFLRSGFDAWPNDYQRRFPALSYWPGIAGLKRRLNRFAGAPDSNHCLIANRSAQLMTLAARILSSTCRHIFTTDFNWPTYQNILQHEANRSGNRVHVARHRTSVLRDDMRPSQLVAVIVQEFVNHNCDGLFLPAVDNLGIRLPISDIVTAIRRQSVLRFVVVDAAQAFAHVPIGDCLSVADFTIAGCHKWLRGYFPLGIASFGQPSTRDIIHRTASDMLRTAELDDGLLRFCRQLSNTKLDGYSETVNLGHLFSCCGAVADALSTSASPSDSLRQQAANADLVTDVVRDTDWQLVAPHQGLRSGILLLQHRDRSTQTTKSDDIRRLFQLHGVIVTAYDGSLVRLSMPKYPLLQSELRQLRQAFQGLGRKSHVRAAVATNQPSWTTESLRRDGTSFTDAMRHTTVTHRAEL